MLQLLMTYQPSSAAAAHGRGLPRITTSTTSPNLLAPLLPRLLGDPPRGGRAGAGAGPAAGVAGQDPRQAAELAIVINLESVFALVVPLFFLSLKLGFLLWIFGRHASERKRYLLAAMAALWVVWEGYSLLRRRTGVQRERDRAERLRARLAAGEAQEAVLRARLERERERAARRGEDAEGQGEGGVRARGGAHERVRGLGAEMGREEREALPGAAPARPANRRVRAPTSRLTPRYWLNWIAAVGLAEEARELGLVPRMVAGRPVAPVGARDRMGQAAQHRRRAWRTALTAIVLFFGTLSPEVERKRKRALEKRERLLAERVAARQRRAALGQLGADLAAGGVAAARAGGSDTPRSGASTPGVFEAADGMRTPRAASPGPRPGLGRSRSTVRAPAASGSQAATPASTTAGPSSLATVASPTTPTASSSQASAGRAVVSDAELFADGTGEPDQAEEGPASGGDGAMRPETEDSPLATDDEAVVEGRVEEETDEEEDGRRPEEAAEVDQIVALF